MNPTISMPCQGIEDSNILSYVFKGLINYENQLL